MKRITNLELRIFPVSEIVSEHFDLSVVHRCRFADKGLVPEFLDVLRLGHERTVSIGERFGMIKFGSRTDLIVNVPVEVLVKEGMRVRGGVTPIARTL